MKLSTFGLFLISLVGITGTDPAFGQATDATRTVNFVFTGPLAMEETNTLRLGDRRMRLFGIEAPRQSEKCRGGVDINAECGIDALAVALEIIAEAETFECTLIDVNRAGDLVVQCFSKEFATTGINKETNDLGEILVLRGYARMDGSESSARAGIYAVAERIAQEEKRGLWDCDAATPRSWAREKSRNCQP